MAECFPDDFDFEFGIVVTADAQVFRFGFSYYQKPVQLGEPTEWGDLTQTYATATHRPSTDLALRCLRDGLSETAG